MEKYRYSGDLTEMRRRRKEKVHLRIPVAVSRLEVWEQLIMVALLLQLCFCCFCCMEKYPALDVCLKHEKYQQNEVTEHDTRPLLFLAISVLGKTDWFGVLVIFTFFRVICFDSKETLILLIVNPQSLLMIQDQSQEYLCNSIYVAITLAWKFEVPQIAYNAYLLQSDPSLIIST